MCKSDISYFGIQFAWLKGKQFTILEVAEHDDKVNHWDDKQEQQGSTWSEIGKSVNDNMFMILYAVRVSFWNNHITKNLSIAIHPKAKAGVDYWQKSAKLNQSFIYIIRVFKWSSTLVG